MHKFYIDYIEQLTVFTAILYVPMTFLGIYYFKDREPVNLGYIIPCWNMFLSLFSLYGFKVLAPKMLKIHMNGNALDIFTSRDVFYMNPSLSMACFSFVLSINLAVIDCEKTAK